MYLTFSLLLSCTYSQNKGCYISWVTSGTEQKGNIGSNAFMIVHQNTYRRVTFTFSEISNYWQESLLEVTRQNIAGWCQQFFCFQKFVVSAQQYFAFTTQVNFPANNLNFRWRQRWWDRIQAIFLNLFYFISCSSAEMNH